MENSNLGHVLKLHAILAMLTNLRTVYACWSTTRISIPLPCWASSFSSILETSSLSCRGNVVSTSSSIAHISRQPRRALACSSWDGGDTYEARTAYSLSTGAKMEKFLEAGRRYVSANDFSSAVGAFRHAVGMDPRSAVALSELGRALVRDGKATEGFETLISAFELDSLCPGLKKGFRDYYRVQIEANPSDIDLHEGLAALCLDSGRPQEAAVCYRRCLELSSELPSGSVGKRRQDVWHVALFKCHASLCEWRDWSTEVDKLRAAVRRGRRDAEGDDRAGRAHPLQAGQDDANEEKDGEATAPESMLLETAGDEQPGGVTMDESRSARRKPLDQISVRPVLHPFDSLSAPISIDDCLVVAREQSLAVLGEAREALPCDSSHGRSPTSGTSVPGGGRLRLGYVSGDLMDSHPLTHLMQSVFGMHDREGFEVFLYALNPSDGSVRRIRLENEVEHFRDVSSLTSRETAEVIERDGISILVNLNGYAGTARSADIFALRPADVAVSYMGFPGTLGSAELVDYILADRIVIPPELRRYYAEKVLEMPRCYFVNDYFQSELAIITSPPVARSDHGLPPGGDDLAEVLTGHDRRHSRGGSCHPRENGRYGDQEDREGPEDDAVVLCNFNRLHKIDPGTFGAWMKVLKATPTAVLWLLDGGEIARANLRREASLAGVEKERLVFAPLVGKQEHLRRLRAADLFVDTPLYNAHTVGCDALWAGVPMVTLRGERMASRVGASLLLAAGLPELVTDSVEEYTRLVQELARNGERRREIRRKLASSRTTCSLFDTRQWVVDAESTFYRVWERHQEGLPPAHLGVLNHGFEEDRAV